ncbi:immunoglobulin-binding protein sbi [Staphylococcus chromogenes]|uniref:C3-binding domain-containing protein n=1 Tax=Staphylococcus chromogenes TaxID=46126 RepID=UPI00118B62F1|nr:C3-binding domain-containing protein [Staphylococcus chromogenes]QDW90541.1 immunoglobulin-binding protein sbi [Staphylococcus chromogenes]
MINKNISRLLMGAATITLATMIAHGEAKAAEETNTTGQQPETNQVDNAQRAYYKVLNLEGLSEEQGQTHIQTLRENPNRAQEVFSESIKDSNHPERRAGQQNAYYSILNNDSLTDDDKNHYISQLRQNPDKSQDIWYQTLHHQPEVNHNTEQTPSESTPKVNETTQQTSGHLTREQAIARDNELTSEANTSLSELLKTDSIENRRQAQRNVNKAPLDVKPQLQQQLDFITAQHDEKVRQNSQKATEATNSRIDDAYARQDEQVRKINNALTQLVDKDSIDHRRQAQREVNKAPHDMKERLQKQLDLILQKHDTQKPGTTVATETQTTQKAETPKVEAPVQTETAPKAPSYYQTFKNYVRDGYNKLSDTFNKGYNYVADTYKDYSKKYQDAKYYVGKYYQYKRIIDPIVLGTLGSGWDSHISPITINKDNGVLYNTYAKARNYVTEGINTGKVLYAFYQNPNTVKNAIKVAETATTFKNTVSNLLSVFWK